MLVGAVLGVSVSALAIGVVAPAISHVQAERQDRETIDEINQIYASDMKLADVARQIQSRINEIQNDARRHEQNIRLAGVYTDMGESLFHQGDLLNAEQSFRRANQLDGTGARAMADLGALFSALGAKEDLLDDRLKDYTEAIRWWTQAADASSTDATLVSAYEEHAAEVYLAESKTLNDAARYQQAGSAIREGLGLVPAGSPLARKLVQQQTTVDQAGAQVRVFTPSITTVPSKDRVER